MRTKSESQTSGDVVAGDISAVLERTLHIHARTLVAVAVNNLNL